MRSRTRGRRNADASAILTLLFIVLGPIVWALHLTVVYGAHTLMCVTGAGSSAVFGLDLPRLTILAVTLLSLGALAAILRWGDTRNARENASERRFQVRTMRWLVLLSVFGVLLAGGAALFVDPCTPLR